MQTILGKLLRAIRYIERNPAVFISLTAKCKLNKQNGRF